MAISPTQGDLRSSPLYEKIKDAQFKGQTCFINNPALDRWVVVAPESSDLLSIRLLQLEEGNDLSLVQFGLETPGDCRAYIGTCADEEDLNEFESDCKRFYALYPADSIQSLDEFSRLLKKEFGSDKDDRVWSACVHYLDQSISDEVVHRLVLPLLEAGEFPLTVTVANHFLTQRGWSQQKINESYSQSSLQLRTSRHYFFENTGLTVDTITTHNQLVDAILPVLNDYGAHSAVVLICDFILSHPADVNEEQLRAIVEPFFSLFGPGGHQRFEEVLDERWDFYRHTWECPEYKGELPCSPELYDAFPEYGTSDYGKWWESPSDGD